MMPAEIGKTYIQQPTVTESRAANKALWVSSAWWYECLYQLVSTPRRWQRAGDYSALSVTEIANNKRLIVTFAHDVTSESTISNCRADELRAGLDGWTGDALDVVYSRCLAAKGAPVLLSASDLLRTRGRCKRMHGYSGNQVASARRSIEQVGALSLALCEGESTTRGMVFDVRSTANGYKISPGAFLQDKRSQEKQVVALDSRVLALDPYRQAAAKRIAHYLTYRTRVDAKNNAAAVTTRVNTLITRASIKIDTGDPGRRTRMPLERALDLLAQQGIIVQWRYCGGTPSNAGHWREGWLRSVLEIEMPASLVSDARAVARRRAGHLGVIDGGKYSDLSDRIANVRTQRGLNLTQLAEEVGVSRTTLSRIESRKTQPRQAHRIAIEKWLSRQ